MRVSPRLTLQIDTVTCAAMAALLLVLASPLSDWLDMPIGFLRWVGVGLLPWIALLAWSSTRERVTKGIMEVVLAVNGLWVIASVGVLLANVVEPNGWGISFIVVQAIAVCGLTALQAMSLSTANHVSHHGAELSGSGIRQ